MSNNIPFAKMHASGNDFIIIDNRRGPMPPDVSVWAARLCRRRFSVGADGLILIEDSVLADFRWRYFNSDGSEVEMCGNGSRCAARFAFMKGIAGPKLAFETLAGIIDAEVKDDSVKVRLTNPFDYRPEVSLGSDAPGPKESCYINTGVPHVVYFVGDTKTADVLGLGARTRYHQAFAPAGTNANFVTVDGRNQMTIRTYERGVEGETMACGTGAVAAALIAGARGLVDPPVRMKTRGGNILTVYFNWNGVEFSEVYLEGDAVLVYQGVLEQGALL